MSKSKPAHPPVLPVGKMFQQDVKNKWWFRPWAHGEVRITDAVGDRRLCISALQQYAFRKAAQKYNQKSMFESVFFCFKHVAAWEKWEKKGVTK